MTAYLQILCFFLRPAAASVKTPNANEFSINVTTLIKEESGGCIEIPYELTFPTNKVPVPNKMILFRGDPRNKAAEKVVENVESGKKGTFIIDAVPSGEDKYGFKLEWECNQTYVFPKRVRILVSELTKKPHVRIYKMTEGQSGKLQCDAPRLCSGLRNIYWKWSKADGSTVLDSGQFYQQFYGNTLTLDPTADDHNTKITCVAEYDFNNTETTVTLSVNFYPKIQNGSRCMVDGKLLVCVCISRGNPPPPITWPLAALTDFSVSSSSSDQTVHSIFTMAAAHYHNTSVKCISSNGLGQAEIEIPLQNSTGNLMLPYGLDSSPKCDAVRAWITAGMSLSLILVLLTILIICNYKCCRAKSQQRDPGEEMNTYASLNRADVEQDYSVISQQNRNIT